MQLLPFALRTSGAFPSGPLGERQETCPPGPCRFCGFYADCWMEPVAGAVPRQPASLVAACVLCSLGQNLDRPTIDAEARLIWWPDATQAALIATVRRLHVICWNHACFPTMDRYPGRLTDELRSTWGLNAALSRRAAEAERRCGTTSIREFGAAIAEIPSSSPALKALSSGLRVLPAGKFFRDHKDVYPSLLASLTRVAGELP